MEKQTNFQHTVTLAKRVEGDKTILYRCLECESIDRSLTYSLLVTLIENGEVADERFIYDLTSDSETACRIFDILTENSVTPFGIEYVLDSVYDILADQ